MRRRRKMVRGIVMMVVIAAMFSMTALAAQNSLVSFTYNTQTSTYGPVQKNNYNTEAEVKSLSGSSNVDSSICALQHGGTITAYCQLSPGAGQSGRMVFTAPGQTKYGTYGSYSYGSKYYLAATLTGCSFQGTYMRQRFSWTP